MTCLNMLPVHLTKLVKFISLKLYLMVQLSQKNSAVFDRFDRYLVCFY